VQDSEVGLWGRMVVEPVFLAASIVLLLVAFLATHLIMPWLIAALRKAEITGRDVHKRGGPEVPTMGGIGVFVGFATAMTFSALLGLDYRLLFAIFLSGTLALVAGLIDDLFTLGKLALIVVTFLVSMPIVAFHAGSTLVFLTPVGPADLGWFFWILVPFAFAFSMNGVNVYAGFNGLEAGLGVVSSVSLAICAILYGSWESAFSLFALSGALLSFLKWNWYPAKVFIGNSGTMLLGAVLASSIIVGSIKVVGVIVFIPYMVNFLLRARDRFNSTVADVKVRQNGDLENRRLTALWGLFMYRSPVKETSLVSRCILTQLVFGIAAVIFAYYHVAFILPHIRT
jgi:UDP-N-acetylglucosamine--dolichyl-phosphate N-acetylglucosaminephosphotransferase